MKNRSVLLRSAVGLIILVAAPLVSLSVYAIRDQAKRQAVAQALTGGDPLNAPLIFRRYGCVGCHTIPGIPGADGKVGAALDGLQQRVYIAGVANNTPDSLVHWIVSPQRFSPNTAMPTTGISEPEARDLAAYLYAH